MTPATSPAALGADPRATARRTALALAVVGVPYALCVARFWYVTDDAYISFRYARNWAEGLGLRYNPGEQVPVEGFSNFLWVALSALAHRVGAEPATWMPGLSAACGATLLWRLFRALRALGVRPAVTCAVTCGLGIHASFAVWSTSGLETMSFALLLFATFELALLRERPAPALAGALALAVALSRPEGVAWAVLLGALAVVSRRARDARLGAPRYFAVLGAGYAVYLAWRLSAFGHFLPTSATAKLSAGFGADRLARGLEYVAAQVAATPSWALVAPAAAWAVCSSRRAVLVPAALLALAFPAWSVAVSGDFMAFGRFLVPGLAFLALVVGASAERLGRSALPAAAAFGLLGALAGFRVHLVPSGVREALDFRPHLGGYRSELAYWTQQRNETQRWVERGRALAQLAEPGDSIVLSAIGAVGYWSDLFVFDRVGLVTREVAELEPTGDARDATPGHDNPVEVAWFLERGERPTFVKANFHGVSGPQELRAKAERSRANLRALGFDELYFLDVLRVERRGRDPEPPLPYLFVWRRPPSGATLAAAAGAAERRLERHLAGADDLPAVRLPESAQP